MADPLSTSPRPSRPAAAVRLEEVAAAAGVSIITASRALHRPGRVAVATRERVRAAADRLGYIANRLAAGLVSARTRVIGAIVPTLANPVHAEALQAATSVLALEGYQVLLGATGYSEKRELELARALLGHRVDGLIVTGVQHAADCAALLAGAGLPVVETFDLAERPLHLNVGFSNRAAGEAMTRHLIDRGRRRLAFVEHADADDSRMRARREGFLAACAAAGLEGRVLATPGDPTTAESAAIAEAILARMPEVDAILFAGHQLAAGAIHHLIDRGIAVPGRIAVAGFGDSPVARWVRPDLTTIRFPMARMGAEAARLLLAGLAGTPPAARRVDLGFELVVRDSS